MVHYRALANALLIVLLTYFGFRKGKKAEEQAPSAEQPRPAIAGALIDSAKADELPQVSTTIAGHNPHFGPSGFNFIKCGVPQIVTEGPPSSFQRNMFKCQPSGIMRD